MPSKIYPFDAFTPIGLPQPRTEHAQLTGRLRRPVNKSASSAFTLIELLTVIAIIGILAAIIIPTVGKVRKTAQQSTCASNLRQLALGFQMYANDHKDFLPMAYGPLAGTGVSATYPLQIGDYIARMGGEYKAVDKYGGSPTGKGVSICPTAAGKGYTLTQSYGVNRYLYTDNPNSTKPVKLSQITQPSRTILLGDTTLNNDGAPGASTTASTIGWTTDTRPGREKNVTQPTDREHTNGGANLVFCDGHVKFWQNTYDFVAESKYHDGGSDDVWSWNK